MIPYSAPHIMWIAAPSSIGPILMCVIIIESIMSFSPISGEAMP